MDKKKLDELLNSNYDGIKEYDNDLPKWWLALFYITIIFGGVYVLYYHVGSGLNSQEQLAADMAAIEKLKSTLPVAKVSSADELLKLASSAPVLAKGKEIYVGKCAACHGAAGEGLVGPNLTDTAWIHGSKITDIKNIIENGFLEKGMLAWKGIISAEEIDAVTAFVHSIRGSNPPNARPPQGVVENG